MNIKKRNVFRLLSLAFVTCAFIAPQNLEAQRKKKKKKSKTEAVMPKPKSKTKSIKDLTKSSKKIEGLFTMYRDTITGSLQMLISDAHLDKDYIHFNQVSNGVVDAGRFRGAYGGSKVFKVKKYYNKIEFVSQNTSFYFDPENAISKSKDANMSEGIMATVKIEAHDKKEGLYLIKADGLFLKETFTQVKPPRFPGSNPFAFTLGNLDKTKTKINSIKNYEDNTNLEIEYVYSKPSVLNGASQSASSGCNFTTIAFLNPAFSNALFHSKTPCVIVSLHSTGVVFSIHHVIGSTGSDIAALGSFFTKCHL